MPRTNCTKKGQYWGVVRGGGGVCLGWQLILRLRILSSLLSMLVKILHGILMDGKSNHSIRLSACNGLECEKY